MGSILIRDGMTMDGYIAPVPGVHDGVKFKYRPVAPGDYYGFLEADRSTGAKRLAETVKVVQKYLVEWDVQEDRPGQDASVMAPIHEANLRRMIPWVLERMSNIMMGYVQSDQFQEDLKN